MKRRRCGEQRPNMRDSLSVAHWKNVHRLVISLCQGLWLIPSGSRTWYLPVAFSVDTASPVDVYSNSRCSVPFGRSSVFRWECELDRVYGCLGMARLSGLQPKLRRICLLRIWRELRHACYRLV